MGQRIEGALVVAGRLTPSALDVPDATIDNAAVKSSAGIAASKLEHQHVFTFTPGVSTLTAAAGAYVLHTCYGTTGQVLAFKAGLVTPCTGDATVTLDLYKNGATMLSSTFDLDSADAALALVAGTIDPAKEDLAADDVLTAVVTVNAGTGSLGAGLFFQLVATEDAA